ncbi:ATP-binding protein [Xylanibacter ruminicola]|uniref:histidine kinase n=1 Tax=Xylanibacter ruminicola TaxID=839 RepID=A0A1M6RLY3_XYLRU|nr:transporter substrate-binding domain-containing protein [Xylanibacter ruminicola]SHK33454.1 Signal transduction histidine kinase [Xylanibacter ruminicola]
MKLDNRRWMLLVAVLLSFLTTVGVSAQKSVPNPTITIGLDANYAPLQYVDKNGIPHGYDVTFTRALMSRMGVKFYYVPSTWKKVEESLIKGDIDLAMMVYSSYRKDSVCYSRPIFRLYYQVVYRKSDYKSFDFRNIKGKTFAFLNSRPIGELMDREGAISVRVYDLDEAIRDLAKGKYDAVICYRYQAKYLINHYHLDQLQAEDISMQPREYCYVSHNQDLIDDISREIAMMEAEGIVDEIYGNDIVETAKSKIPVWVWYLFGAVGVLFVGAYIFLSYRSRKKLKIANAMLETNYKILEMSHMELEETNRQLIAATEKAEESSKMKSNFIKQISHEIRTPLNILSGFVQVITTPGLELQDDEKIKIGQDIVLNTNRITNLVNKMLELSDAGSRNVIERNENTTAAQIAGDAVTATSIADANGIKFELSIEPEAEKVNVVTNLNSAVRALSLILDNARKFSGGATDKYVRLTVMAKPNTIELAVEDNGIGVPPNEAEHIFEEFVQLDDFYEGTGIGLTIARSLARRMGGDVTLDTSYSPGARFILTLPR